MKYAIAFGLFTALIAGVSAQPAAIPTQAPTPEILAANPEANSATLQTSDIFYMSDRFGFRFVIPSGYTTASGETSSAKPAPLEVIEIWNQADYLNRENLPEAPPIISIRIYSNPQKLPLAKWKGELSHNDDRPMTVAGQPALAYSSTGLYESDNVLVRSPDSRQVLRLQAGYQTSSDRIRQVFQEVIQSFSFDVLPSTNSTLQQRINYNRLQSLLAARNWQAADVETRAILQRLAGSQGDLLYSSKSVLSQLPCEDLRTVDQLWSKASAGRFGYKTQQRLWQQASTRTSNSKQRVERFGQAVGWRRTQPLPQNNPVGLEISGTQWRLDTELNYTATAPVGQFPWAGVSSTRLSDLINERFSGCGSCSIDAMNLASDRYYDYVPALFTRLKACRL
jgi:hypothetical protein